MKTYKNTLISLVAYVVSALLVLWDSKVHTDPYTTNWVGIILFIPAILIGIFFGFRSNKRKESSWMGKILILIGILVLLYPLYAVPFMFYIGDVIYK